MRFEGMTPEMIEKAKVCETAEGRTAFPEENGIELDDGQLEGIAGENRPNEQVGIPTYCPRHPSHEHWWSNTGITDKSVPGKVMMACVNCGRQKRLVGRPHR